MRVGPSHTSGAAIATKESDHGHSDSSDDSGDCWVTWSLIMFDLNYNPA